MSYSLRVAAPRAPLVSTVIAQLADDAIVCREHPTGITEADWPVGVLHFHHDGKSSRGVEVIHEPPDLRVRVVALSNDSDWDLAYRLLRAFGKSKDAEIEGEDGTKAKARDLETAFATARSRETAAAFLSMVDALERSPEALVTLPGPVRPVFIGRRLLAELPRDGAEGALALMERVRRIQYLEEEGLTLARPIPMVAATGVHLTVWQPTVARAFERTSFLGLTLDSGVANVPVSGVPALVGDRFTWLDEHRFLIAATPEAELPALQAKAAPLGVDPYAKTKKWWQFWR